MENDHTTVASNMVILPHHTIDIYNHVPVHVHRQATSGDS